MMKILILANNDVGLYKFRKELIQELLQKNQVYICLPDGDYITQLKEMGCKFIPCEFNRHGINPLEELKLIKFYKDIIKKNIPDMVFTYTIKPNVYGGMVCAAIKIPYVVNITGLGTAVENKGIIQKITLMLYKRGLRRAQKVFFQNQENLDFMLHHGVIRGAYDLLPGSGVNLSQYQVLDYPSGDTVDFVFVARIMKEKGIEQYLDAAIEIRKLHPETRFHICGFCEQAYEMQLKKLQEDGTIIYHGMVEDMEEIYRKMCCTIHPTYYPEGLSNVLLESAACGRPIITTDRSGCREVVENGVNGYVIQQKNSEDLIKKLKLFLSLSIEERRNMGIMGRKKVEKEFDRKIVVNKYIEEVKYGLQKDNKNTAC